MGVPVIIFRHHHAENDYRRAIRLYLFSASCAIPQRFSSRRRLPLQYRSAKKDTASIPNAVQILTSMSKSARQVFLSKNLLLFGTTAIRGGVEQCISVYIAQRRVLLCKNSPLHGTTDIRVRFEMYILVHFWTRVLAKPKHRYCLEPPPSMAVLTGCQWLPTESSLLCKFVVKKYTRTYIF